MPVNRDQLESAGQAILNLLHTAAHEAETDSRQTLETAQRLSGQLHAASRSDRGAGGTDPTLSRKG